MTAPEVMTEHPTDETLAAFIDDRLKGNQRREAIEHLADCDECRTFVNDLSDIKAMDEADNVVEMPKRGGWRAAVASFAVAAGLLVVFGPPIRDWAFGASMGDLQAASPKMEFRPTAGRFSVDLAYKEPKTTLRGGGEKEPEPLIVEGVPVEVYYALDDLDKAKRPDPHVFGVALLMATKYDEAIPYLETAAEKDEKAKIDLAAALLARGGDGDYKRALELSKQSDAPAALWNRAAALEKLQQDDAAIKAWKAYLNVDRDPESGWAKEAQKNIAGLEYDKGFAAPFTK